MLRCLLLYVEPTPYILPCIADLRLDNTLQYEAYFITENASQRWDLPDLNGIVVLLKATAPWWQNLRRVSALAKGILSGRYAVAHLAGWGHPILLLCMICLRIRRTPFSMESDTQLGHQNGSAKEWIKRSIYPRLFRWPKAVLPAGRRQAEFFRFYGVSSQRITVAYMTVDVAKILSFRAMPRQLWRRQHGISATDTIFLFVGRLEFRKGLHTLLAAFEKIRIQRRCFLVVVGAGSMQAKIKRIATTLDGLILLGQKSFPEVIQWMKSSEVLVLPSLHEPWGLVVNEAMACGMAVIASDRVGAVDDLVVDGSNGFVVPAGDCRALSEAMQKLLLQPELSKMMGAVSLGIIKPWTIEREAGTIKTVIHRIQETR